MTTEPTVPARLLDDVRVSMKELLAQNINAWGEVDRLHEELREAVSDEAVERLRESLWSTWGQGRQTTDWPSLEELRQALLAAVQPESMQDLEAPANQAIS